MSLGARRVTYPNHSSSFSNNTSFTSLKRLSCFESTLCRVPFYNLKPFQFRNIHSITAYAENSIFQSQEYLNELNKWEAQHPGPYLMRDFVTDSLYNPTYGYFNRHDELIVSPEDKDCIDFHNLKNQKEYVEHVRTLYNQGAHSWATPSVLFFPHYGKALLNYILKQRKKFENPLRILEIGGGNGRCAQAILDTLKEEYPDLYKRTRYDILEMSETLHRIQKDRNRHHSNFNSYPISITDWKEEIHEECFILGLEVMDNMPHDKVVDTENNLYQVIVDRNPEDSEQGIPAYSEHYTSLQDSLIRQYLHLSGISQNSVFPTSMPSFGNYRSDSNQRDLRRQSMSLKLWRYLQGKTAQALSMLLGGEVIAYVPTVALQMLYVLDRFIPNHHLILADFDFLPNALPGLNGPVVQRKYIFNRSSQQKYKSNQNQNDNDLNSYIGDLEDLTPITKTFESILVPKGSCDIFYPTNFQHLQTVYHSLRSKPMRSTILKQEDFMREHADLKATSTKDGYNPLMSDYRNMSFFISSPEK